LSLTIFVSDIQTYDPSLLAVIGILDALKHESNVAGWIRDGWVRVTPPAVLVPAGLDMTNGTNTGVQSIDQGTEEKAAEVRQQSGTDAVLSTVTVNKDTTDRGVRGGRKAGRGAKKKRHEDPAVSVGSDASLSILPSSSSSSSPPPHSSPPPSSPSLPSSPSIPGLGTAHAAPISRTPNHFHVNVQPPPPQTSQPQLQWYEDPETAAYWVDRGLKALDELGIEVVTGIEE
jgi:hypothetical protein